jgi:hypothetical protein
VPCLHLRNHWRLYSSMGTSIRGPTEYYVLLVSKPAVHAYGIISDQFCSSKDQPKDIPWDSPDTHSIPPMLPSLRFRRLFALCLLPRKVWESQTKTIAQKLSGQLFWEYHGSDTDFSQAKAWSDNEIRSINAIQDLGVALSGEDAAELCTECK